ncbi:response regulator transcription factor, partial [Candidatus Bipolaricaulota bacterium]|nr:response regulator transcription factor [Candidatus Bipolaricaulota bacterium]
RDVTEFGRSVRDDFRASCRRRTITFEEFAEQWIVRDQLDSLGNAVKFLVMGDGLYVEVLVHGELLLSERDDGRRVPEQPGDELPPGTTMVDDLPDGGVEVRVPIVLTGYPNASFGLLRIGFSGSYAVAQVRGQALTSAGMGVGIWAAFMVATAIGLICSSLPANAVDATILRCGTLEIDAQACRATLNGLSLDLTPKLYDLLLLFVRNAGSILSDGDVLEAVWPDSTYAASADVKQHIYLLRQKLAVAHPDPKCVIVNVKGFGYRLDPPTNENDLSSH